MAQLGETEKSQKKTLTEEQKARLVNDVSIALKQMEEEECKKQKLKLLSEKLIKENHELKDNNETILYRLVKVEEELSETKKLLLETIEEQNRQKQIVLSLTEHFQKLKGENGYTAVGESENSTNRARTALNSLC